MKDLDEQYRSDTNLRTRVETHQRYTTGPELEPAVDAALALEGDEMVLDVGTAYGDFPARLRRAGHRGRLIGLDSQPGMIDEARRRHREVTFVCGDAEHLPFGDGSFDVVTARHMLYHVPDIAAALKDARRVLRSSGRFLAVTNSRDTMGSFWEVVAAAASADPSMSAISRDGVGLRFAEHNAEPLIGAAFGNVTVTRLHARLEFPSPEPVERYFQSCLPGFAIADPESAAASFSAALRERWPSHGPWVVDKTILLFTARKPR